MLGKKKKKKKSLLSRKHEKAA